MTNPAFVGLAALAGLGVGLVYFAALRWNIHRMIRSDRPWAWALGGFIVRARLAAAAIGIASGGRWQGFLACLAGFFAARVLAVRRYGPAGTGKEEEGETIGWK